MDLFSVIISLCLGIGLSASAGFRVFLPLFVLSLAAKFGFDLNAEWAWIGSWTAIITLGIATFVEIVAYYIPWVDNILDTIAVPLAGFAGTMLMAMSLGDFDSQIIQWGLAIIAGGGTAASIKGATAGGRLASTATTGGLGNFAISSGETAAASVLSLTSIFIPILGAILVIVFIYFIFKALKKVKNTNFKIFNTKRNSTTN